MAFVSDVSICSNALGYLGAQPITSLTDDPSERAKICNRVYATTRNALLQEHGWNFATVRVALNLLVDTPAWGYTSQFQLPVGLLQVVETDPKDLDYRIEGDKLLCNESAVNLKYIKEVTDPLLFSSHFVTALEYKLASVLAIPITGDVAKAQAMAGFLSDSLGKSKNLDTTADALQQYDADEMDSVRTIF